MFKGTIGKTVPTVHLRMYTKQEASQLRSRFWTTFGQYMRPVTGAEGVPVNWLNYKTGIKQLFFRMDADQKRATIAVEIRQQFPDERYRLYEKWENIRNLFESELGEEWTWQRDLTDEDGSIISRISKSIPLNIFNEQDWPALISFLKPRIIALDAIWTMVKDSFDDGGF